jgi:hypothetical protein
MLDAAPTLLTRSQIFANEYEGHTILRGEVPVERLAAFTLVGPEEEAARVEQLRTKLTKKEYTTAPLSIARLRDAYVDLRLGLSSTSTGQLLEESVHVAAKIDPSLESPLTRPIAVGELACSAAVASPVIHCFHRACGAYGHFVLDGLILLEHIRDEILAGRIKVLVPPYLPEWATQDFRALGLPDEALIRPHAAIVQCRWLLVASSINAKFTVLPDPALCKALRDRLSPKSSGQRRLFIRAASETRWKACISHRRKTR